MQNKPDLTETTFWLCEWNIKSQSTIDELSSSERSAQHEIESKFNELTNCLQVHSLRDVHSSSSTLSPLSMAIKERVKLWENNYLFIFSLRSYFLMCRGTVRGNFFLIATFFWGCCAAATNKRERRDSSEAKSITIAAANIFFARFYFNEMITKLSTPVDVLISPPQHIRFPLTFDAEMTFIIIIFSVVLSSAFRHFNGRGKNRMNLISFNEKRKTKRLEQSFWIMLKLCAETTFNEFFPSAMPLCVVADVTSRYFGIFRKHFFHLSRRSCCVGSQLDPFDIHIENWHDADDGENVCIYYISYMKYMNPLDFVVRWKRAESHIKSVKSSHDNTQSSEARIFCLPIEWT